SAKPKADKVVIQEPEQGTTTPTLTTTTAATTITAVSTRPRAKGIVIHEHVQAPTPTVSSQQLSQVNVQDNGKGKMVEPEPVKKMSKKDLLRLDEELAFKLQAEKLEEERLAREKAQQLAQRLQAQEQEELTDEEKERLFVQFLEQRRKHFATKRAEEKRNRPPIRAQQRSIMCTYLKNIEGWKPKSLKNKSFANIQELFDKAMKRMNTFALKVDEDKETIELQSFIEIVPNEEEVAIDAIPLATKPPTIVDWKIHKEGKNSYYQIIRADGSSKMYRVFSQMLKSFDRQDLEDLYKLDYRVLDWKIYDSCGVHSLRMQHVYIHMLVEKQYPLTPATITDMLNKKLQCDHFSEMLSIKKLEILKKNIKFKGGLLGLKAFLKLLLLSYYCSKIKTAERVSTVRERIKTEERIKIVWRSRLLT
ncbi:hypothetical protein Tco_1442734, partial [Tanacetum coccineum]